MSGAEKHELGAQTLWTFLSCGTEPRHLQDIVFAVHVLRLRGVAWKDILVFTDHPAPEKYLQPFGIHNAFPVAELAAQLSGAAPHSSVVLTVTGHGSPTGLGDGTAVTPSGLCSSIRKVPEVAICVVVLAQCFGGVFNYLDATRQPPLVIIGATNLNASLSTLISLAKPIVQEDGAPGLVAWLANLFMFFFFTWIQSPHDIDGDGELNLVDAYKFAGVVSNLRLQNLKTRLFREAELFRRQCEQTQEAAAKFDGTPDAGTPPHKLALLEAETAQKKLQTTLENLYLHQEPWILHANLARTIQFSGFLA